MCSTRGHVTDTSQGDLGLELKVWESQFQGVAQLHALRGKLTLRDNVDVKQKV